MRRQDECEHLHPQTIGDGLIVCGDCGDVIWPLDVDDEDPLPLGARQ